MQRCTVSAPTSQIRLSRSSEQRNDPSRGTSRMPSTARTCVSRTGRSGCIASIRTNRKPLGPIVCVPSQGSVTIWSRTAWSLPAFFWPPSSAIASLADSPNLTRARTGSLPGVSGVESRTCPWISRPKSRSTPPVEPGVVVITHGGNRDSSSGCPGCGARSVCVSLTPCSLCQTNRTGSTKNSVIGDRFPVPGWSAAAPATIRSQTITATYCMAHRPPTRSG